jgi:hypothetical protein
MSISSGSVLAKIAETGATAICWSPKGKQITVGNQKGFMSQYDLEGNLKSAVEPPPAMTVAGGESEDRYGRILTILAFHQDSSYLIFIFSV